MRDRSIRRARILAALADHGPLTARQIDAVTGWRTVLPELGPLEDEGLVVSGRARAADGTYVTYYRLNAGAAPARNDKEGN